MKRSCLLASCLLAVVAAAQQITLQGVNARLRADPENPRLWAAKGVLLEQRGSYKESIESFEHALRISPKFAPALMGATEAAYQTRDPKAPTFVKRLLDLQPDNATANAIAGELAFEGHDCESATAYFAKGGDALARNAPALAHRGTCLARLGRAGEAAGVFRDLVRLAPEDAAAAYNLALTLHLSHQDQAALPVLKDLSEKHPRDAETWNLLGTVYEASGDVKAAVEALRRATQVAPKDERNYLDLAQLCLDHNSTDLALEIVNVGIRNIPDSAKLYTTRGAIYSQIAKLDQAQADFETASRLEPDKLYGSVGMSMLLRQTEHLPEAIALLTGKLKRTPNDPVLNYLLADAIWRTGPDPGQPEFSRARESLLRALKAKPDFGQAWAALGKLYVKEGRTAEAVNALRKSIQYDPTDRTALNQLVLALHKEGKQEEADAMAAKLRAELEQAQKDEVSRNRVRLTKTE